MRTPEDIAEAAERRGLAGWQELARFLGEYQDVLDDLDVVDFGALLQRAANVASEGPPLFDHLLVDDLQDTTLAAEAILKGLRANDLVAAADPDAAVFTFQGMSRLPLDRFAETFPGSTAADPHHESSNADVRADRGLGHAARLRGARRRGARAAATPRGGRHRVVGDGRRGPAPGCAPGRAAARARRRPHPPRGARARALPHGRARHAPLRPGAPLARGGRPPTRGARRAAAHLRRRGALPRHRARAPAHRARGDRLDRRMPSTWTRGSPRTRPRRCAPPARRSRRHRCSRACRCRMRSACSGRSSPVRCSWWSAAGHEAEARRELDTVVTFANVVAEADDGADKSVQGFLESLDAGEHGPGHSAWERSRPDAVRVLTAHGTVGREFDAVLVTGVSEGNFPSVHRAEPMFDLAVLDRVITNAERNRERLEEERRLFDTVLARARKRVVLVCADAHPDADELSVRSRFVHERGLTWTHAPAGPFEEPVSVREASATWRHQLADPRSPRLAAPRGARGHHGAGRRPGTLVVPARLDRHGPPAARAGPRLVLAPVQPGGVRADARARRRARPRPSRRVPRVGGQDRAQDHRGDRARRDREGAARDGGGAGGALAPAGVPVARRLRGVPPPGARAHAAQLVRDLRRHARARHRAVLRVRVRGRAGDRLHRPDRAVREGRHHHHRLQDRQERQRRAARGQPAARHLLPGGAGGGGARGVQAGARRGARVPARQLEEPARSSSARCPSTRATRRSTRRGCASAWPP